MHTNFSYTPIIKCHGKLYKKLKHILSDFFLSCTFHYILVVKK